MQYEIELNEEEEFHHKLAQRLTKLFFCIGELSEGRSGSRRYIQEIQTTLDAINHESRERRIAIRNEKNPLFQLLGYSPSRTNGMAMEQRQ